MQRPLNPINCVLRKEQADTKSCEATKQSSFTCFVAKSVKEDCFVDAATMGLVSRHHTLEGDSQ
ncbi:MAG: hypothetical protein ACRCYY_10435 [Trueperaceae bacterium]